MDSARTFSRRYTTPLIFMDFPAPYAKAPPHARTRSTYIPAATHTHPQSPCIRIPSMPTPRPPDQRGFAVGLHRQVRWQALSGAPIVTQVPSLRRRRGIGLPGAACPPGGGPLRLLRPGEQIPWERWGYEPRGAVTPKASQLYLFGYPSRVSLVSCGVVRVI